MGHSPSMKRSARKESCFSQYGCTLNLLDENKLSEALTYASSARPGSHSYAISRRYPEQYPSVPWWEYAQTCRTQCQTTRTFRHGLCGTCHTTQGVSLRLMNIIYSGGEEVIMYQF